MSQAELAARSGTSQATVSRIERGWPGAPLDVLSNLATASGHDLALRLFATDGSRLRDRGQVRLIELIIYRAAAAWHASTEVPTGADGSDPRAIDLVLASAVEVLAIEVQRHIADAQAETRRHLLKRDALQAHGRRPVRYLLALPDTRRMRDLVRDHRTLCRSLFPISSRRAWTASVAVGPLAVMRSSGCPPPRHRARQRHRASGPHSPVHETTESSRLSVVSFADECIGQESSRFRQKPARVIHEARKPTDNRPLPVVSLTSE